VAQRGSSRNGCDCGQKKPGGAELDDLEAVAVRAEIASDVEGRAWEWAARPLEAPL